MPQIIVTADDGRDRRLCSAGADQRPATSRASFSPLSSSSGSAGQSTTPRARRPPRARPARASAGERRNHRLVDAGAEGLGGDPHVGSAGGIAPARRRVALAGRWPRARTSRPRRRHPDPRASRRPRCTPQARTRAPACGGPPRAPWRPPPERGGRRGPLGVRESPGRARGSRRCRPAAATRARPPPGRRRASSRSTAPRNRCETSRPADHGVWYSSRPAKRSSSSSGAPRRRDLLEDRAAPPGPGHELAGQPLQLAVHAPARTRARRCRPTSRSAARPRTRSTAGVRRTAPPPPRPASRPRALGCQRGPPAVGPAQQRRARSEQGPVEIHVQAAHGGGDRSSRRHTRSRWPPPSATSPGPRSCRGP